MNIVTATTAQTTAGKRSNADATTTTAIRYSIAWLVSEISLSRPVAAAVARASSAAMAIHGRPRAAGPAFMDGVIASA